MEIGIKKLISTFSVSSKWKDYQNDKQYGEYGTTPLLTPKNINRQFAQANAKSYLKQYNDSLKIIGTTTNPLIFFYRYDFAIKRIIAVAYMQKYVNMTGDSPALLAEKMIKNKQEFIRQLIERCGFSLEVKLSKLKTSSSKQNNIISFEKEFSLFSDELSQDNKEYLLCVADNLRKKYIHD